MYQDTERKLSIRLIKTALPDSINGFISGSDADGYIIAINSGLSAEDQECAFIHECLHLWRQDTVKDCSVDEIEREAHKTANSLLG